MPNQWKPTPPLEVITPHIRRLWKARLTDKEMVAELQKHIDTSKYGIGLTKFTAIRKAMGLHRARQQGHTVETIRDAMTDLREIYPNAGAREMVSLLFHEKNMSVPRRVVREYFVQYEAHLVRQRKAGRLQRRRFWAAGVNDIWAVDQHDKWLRFGLGLHTCVEPFSGKILWIRVWHSNQNPQLILSYYLDKVKDLGFIPLVTQSDPGSENFGIANAQTMLRQIHDPSLAGTLQHRWMRDKKNVKPEIVWAQLRRRFTPGFERILDHGINMGLYDPNNTLQRMIFLWLFVPWLQEELNSYQDRVNNTPKRRDRNKILPHGRSELIFDSAEDYGALDFKVDVDPNAVMHVHGQYINDSHPVFDLIPGPLAQHLEGCYQEMGRPLVTRDNVWRVYNEVLSLVQERASASRAFSRSLSAALDTVPDPDLDALPLLHNQIELQTNLEYYYMGGVRSGLGLDPEHFQKLDELDNEDEPAIVEVPAHLVVAEFSDDSDTDNVDDF